jgi:hypothetical protein
MKGNRPGLLAWARYAWTNQVPSSPLDLVTTGLAATAAPAHIRGGEANKKPVLGGPDEEPA